MISLHTLINKVFREARQVRQVVSVEELPPYCKAIQGT
jgi:hypothetical protein